MSIKKMAGTAAIAAGLGAAGLGLGAGTAQAEEIWVPDVPGIPWVGHWEWIPDGPPGQIKNRFCPGNPPGHWKGGPHGFPCT
jgi:hypothetical protein